MAEFYYPFDTGNGASVTQAQWQRMAQYWTRSGVAGDASTGYLKVTATGVNMQTTVSPGEAFIRGFFYQTDAPITLTHVSNTAGNPRLDLVVLQLDTNLDLIKVVIKQGTPSATPVAPTPTYPTVLTGNIYEIPLALVRVENGVTAIASTKVTDSRVFTSVSMQSASDASTRETTPLVGTIRFEYDSQKWLGWTGTKWAELYNPHTNDVFVDYAPTLAGITINSDAKKQGRYKLINSTLCHVSIFFKIGTQTISNKDITPTLPFTAAGGHTQIMPFFWQDSSTSPHKRVGIAEIDSGSNVVNRLQITGASTADLDTFRSMGAFDELYVSGSYEVVPQ